MELITQYINNFSLTTSTFYKIIIKNSNRYTDYEAEGNTCTWNLQEGILAISTVTILEIPKFSNAPRISPHVNVAY